MPLRAIAYVSEAPAGLSSTALDALVDDAARFNTLAGVTGVLLFDGGRFLQYFEGPEDGMAAVHERILQARSHHGIVELCRGSVPQRYFPFWGMRWLGVEPALIRQLSAGDWAGFARQVNDGAAVSTGLDRLLDCWRTPCPRPRPCRRRRGKSTASGGPVFTASARSVDHDAGWFTSQVLP